MNKITAAAANHEEAARKLNREVARVFKPGTQVRVAIGNANVEGVVISTSDHWWNPGIVYITNTATGKRRKFDAPYKIGKNNVEVI